MASQVQIMNGALFHLAGERITTPTEGPRGEALSEKWPIARDFVLAGHPWNFALEWATLAAETVTPLSGYQRQFVLPTDPYCLKVHRLADRAAEWKVYGRRLHTDEAAPLKILYIARRTDPGDYSPPFVAALELYLAHSVAYRLTGSRTTADKLLERYLGFMKTGRSLDGQEGTPEAPLEGEFEDARR